MLGKKAAACRKKAIARRTCPHFDSVIYGDPIAIINIKMLFSAAICLHFYCPLPLHVSLDATSTSNVINIELRSWAVKCIWWHFLCSLADNMRSHSRINPKRTSSVPLAPITLTRYIWWRHLHMCCPLLQPRTTITHDWTRSDFILATRIDTRK